MNRDPINDAISNIKNHEMVGKHEVWVRPVSKLLIEILKIFQREGYIGEFEVIEDNHGSQARIELLQRINNCGVIKPRFAVKKDEFDKWEKRFLPSKDFGLLIVSTSQGVMTHKEAKKRGIGGRLIAYVY